jgi:outer membrane protein assembly factor BamB
LVVYALDMNGKGKWRQAVDAAWTRSHPGSRSTPMIHRGRLYLVSGNGEVACLDAKTGRRQWARRMREFGGRPGGWGYAESVLIYKDWAVVKPGGRNCIVALDQATGKTVWTSTGFSGGPEYSSCLAFTYQSKPMIVTGTRSGLVCFDAANGVALWSNPFSAGNTANCPTPAYADGYVFWANGYGKGGICMKLRQAGGRVSAQEAWTTRDMVCHHGGYVIHEGYIYGNNGGGWACLDLKSGEVKWRQRGVGKGSLCWADGMLYLYGESGGRVGLATCSPDGMEMRGTFRVEGRGPSWAHPVVIGGRLYIRYDTNLYCFDVKAK